VVVESVEKPWTLFCMLLLLAVLLVLLDFHHAGQCVWIVSVGIRPCRGRSNCSCFLFQTKEKRVCQRKKRLRLEMFKKSLGEEVWWRAGRRLW